ncbi:MAG: hypothetical protein WDZ49_08485, partial [Litorilinea sp.]
MKLVTFQPAGATPQLGAVAGDRVINLAAASQGRLPNDMRAFLEQGESALALAQEIVNSGATEHSVPLDSVKLNAPITNPSKVVAIGLNYMDHVREQGIKPPTLAVM